MKYNLVYSIKRGDVLIYNSDKSNPDFIDEINGKKVIIQWTPFEINQLFKFKPIIEFQILYWLGHGLNITYPNEYLLAMNLSEMNFEFEDIDLKSIFLLSRHILNKWLYLIVKIWNMIWSHIMTTIMILNIGKNLYFFIHKYCIQIFGALLLNYLLY